MVWVLLALLAALFSAIAIYFKKKLSPNLNKYVWAACFTLPLGILFFIYTFIEGIPVVNTQFYIGLFWAVLIECTTLMLLITAFRKIDLSLAIPMLAFTPLFMLISSPFILGEFPSMVGIGGIVLIVIGAYVLNFKEKTDGWLEPFKNIFKNKGVLYMLIIAFLYALGSSFIKLGIVNSSTSFYFAFFYFIPGLLFLIIGLIKAKSRFNEALHYKKELLGIIICVFIMELLMGHVLHLTLASYAIALKRVNILFATIFGFVFLKENEIHMRLIAALIMVAGTVLIAFS